ncbi:MAG: UDP-glucose 4-epimerase GalE [Erysipelotrichaceae bacterium]
MKILVCGGNGFIGSHTCVELLAAGNEVVIVDNLYNSKIEVVDKIKKISGKEVVFYEGDVCDEKIMEKIFCEHKIDAAIHFAGYKAVGESVKKPLMYYENNLISTFVLCKTMAKHGCFNLVFSSSATVYGNPHSVPITEDFPLGPTTNPYGTTKLMIEQILNDLHTADSNWNIALLRYFNPIGAHESGLIGESPNGIPNNLMPYICQVASKQLDHLNIFGNDYDTIDGTGVRDYIHVVDLAKGHVCAINKLANQHVGIDAYNLGTGIGYSVLQIVDAFNSANQMNLPYVIGPRRDGDIASCFADTSKAFKELNWKAEKDITQMCKDSWNYLSIIMQEYSHF